MYCISTSSCSLLSCLTPNDTLSILTQIVYKCVIYIEFSFPNVGYMFGPVNAIELSHIQ